MNTDEVPIVEARIKRDDFTGGLRIADKLIKVDRPEAFLWLVRQYVYRRKSFESKDRQDIAVKSKPMAIRLPLLLF